MGQSTHIDTLLFWFNEQAAAALGGKHSTRASSNVYIHYLVRVAGTINKEGADECAVSGQTTPWRGIRELRYSE
jgi:hypothetical protein